jgi:formate dehydrogenase subunit beta
MREKVENIMIRMGKKNTGKQLDDGLSLEDWEAQWNKCIKCFACRDVCPICWCHECELEKPYFKDDPQSPPDPLGFHGVRLSHMSPSCINCGQCDDVCPMEIPVSKLFHKLQKKYEDRTGYVAGIGDEKPPLYSPMKEDF